jgi:hypothetical protein
MAQKKVDLKSHSKGDFNISEDLANQEKILNLSAILRIADSLDVIKLDKETLTRNAENYKDLWQKQCDIRHELEKKLNSKIRELQKELRIIKKKK